MARYIDADKFKNNLEKAMEKMHLIGGVKGVDVGAVIVALDRQPTADVVPKSEVEELKAIIADHKASEERWEELYSNTKTEVAREIFEEIEKILADDRIDRKLTELGMRFVQNGEPTFEERIAELKKKYTEDDYDG